ncbi:uncharacterized protein LOC111321149 [Stylophora pistillata]|uniref:uncharacterized protein LOC111321149 n=1 Tax=Stylophora pistillata TaxID=50429 RepID=UPI000C03BDD2|nr:uncharacterized protein LOC111321149 [Stylophora pistillata]
MAILVRTCCCGCDLRTGILLIGLFGFLLSGLAIYQNVKNYKTERAEDADALKTLPISNEYKEAVLKLSVVAIAFTVVTVLVNVSLLISYFTLNRYLAYPWFFWQIFSLCYNLGVAIFLITIWDGFTYIFVLEILVWLLMNPEEFKGNDNPRYSVLPLQTNLALIPESRRV